MEKESKKIIWAKKRSGRTPGTKRKQFEGEHRQKGDSSKPLDKYIQSKMPEIIGMLNIGCNLTEIQYVLGVSYDGLTRNIERITGMKTKDFVEQHLATFKISLRRLQMRSASGIMNKKETYYMVPPSVQMQIFLGKNVLGQTDRIEAQIESAPFTIIRKQGDPESEQQ